MGNGEQPPRNLITVLARSGSERERRPLSSGVEAAREQSERWQGRNRGKKDEEGGIGGAPRRKRRRSFQIQSAHLSEFIGRELQAVLGEQFV